MKRKPQGPRIASCNDAKDGFQLTPAEMRLIQAFRKLNDELQWHLAATAEECAKHKDGMRTAMKVPRLRLVRQEAVTEAMQYMTQEEQAVLVDLAKSYANERMDLPARFTVVPGGRSS